MNTSNPPSDFGATAAVVWITAWALGFTAIGFNRLLTRQPDSLSLFLLAGVLYAFLASLRSVSVQPRSSVALAWNLVTLAGMPLAAIAVSRNPALMAIRWTSGRHDLVLLTSSAGVALVWLSIICAGGVAETRHVFQSRAR